MRRPTTSTCAGRSCTSSRSGGSPTSTTACDSTSARSWRPACCASPFNIHWRKDRGKNPDGSERLNDIHLTLAEKLEARKRAGGHERDRPRSACRVPPSGARRYDPNVRVAPVALLWPDEGAQWEPVIDRIAERLPVVTLGDYDPEARRGPAYWVRCVVARTIDVGLPDGTADRVPAGRQPQRAAGRRTAARRSWRRSPSCSTAASGSRTRTTATGRSVRSCPTPSAASGLRIADDADTSEALLLALDRLLDEPVDRLAKQVLDADFFLELGQPGSGRQPAAVARRPAGLSRRAPIDAQWTAFVQQCKADFGLRSRRSTARSPPPGSSATRAGPVGERLEAVRGDAASDTRASPTSSARPALTSSSSSNVDAWPQDNETGRGPAPQPAARLRGADTADGARKEVARLDAEHGWRRGTVWADLGSGAARVRARAARGARRADTHAARRSGLGVARGRLRGARVAGRRCRRCGRSPPYAAQADRDAVSAAVCSDVPAVARRGARALQEAIGPMANAGTYSPARQPRRRPATVTVFVDGLRLDVAHRLEDRLAGAGLDVATDDEPRRAADGYPDRQGRRSSRSPERSLGPGRIFIAANVVDGDEGIDPGAARAHGRERRAGPWARPRPATRRDGVDRSRRDRSPRPRRRRAARRLPRRRGGPASPAASESCSTRAGQRSTSSPTTAGCCSRAAWRRSSSRRRRPRSRRAAAPGSRTAPRSTSPTVPWYWDPDVRIALAPGATCFEANKEYEHGGVSPQECVVPRLTVTAGAQAADVGGPEITKVKWLGLQCRVEFSGVTEQGHRRPARRCRRCRSRASPSRRRRRRARARCRCSCQTRNTRASAPTSCSSRPTAQILAQREVVVGRNR